MDLEDKTVVELKGICRERKIKGFSQLQKRQLINLIKKDARKSDKAAGKAAGRPAGRPAGKPVGRPPGGVRKTGRGGAFLDTKNFAFDSKLRPFGKLHDGELKKLTQADISFLEGEGYKVLKDVSANDMIFDTLPIRSKKYQYRYDTESESEGSESSSDSSSESEPSRGPRKKRAAKDKSPGGAGSKRK